MRDADARCPALELIKRNNPIAVFVDCGEQRADLGGKVIAAAPKNRGHYAGCSPEVRESRDVPTIVHAEVHKFAD